MKLFESDNIWKRQKRQQEAALHPPTPHEKWEQELRSNCLWLFGGILVIVLFGAALYTGAAAMSLTTGVIVLMVILYCGMLVNQILQQKKNEPELTAAERKKSRSRK